MANRDTAAIVETDWLEAHLGDPELRVYDCTVVMHFHEPGGATPFTPESGRSDHNEEHIPGASYLDLHGELSDESSPFHFMLPSEEKLVEAMARNGIGDGTRVVLYNVGTIMLATRVWWMLRALGFDAAVLNGGFDKWKSEGRPVSNEPTAYPAAHFVTRPRPGLFVDKEAVLAAIDDDNILVVNALSEELFRGEEPSRYGRPGRIPGSVNVPFSNLIDPDDGSFVPLDVAKAAFEAAGVDPSRPIIAYCGGGISATIDLFTLHRMGYEKLSLYDASLSEWGRNESLPIERS